MHEQIVLLDLSLSIINFTLTHTLLSVCVITRAQTEG